MEYDRNWSSRKEMIKAEMFLCPECKSALSRVGDNVVCEKDNQEKGYVRDDVIIFHGTDGKADFFEKRAILQLTDRYADFSYKIFKESLAKRELFEMDLPNKKVGIARKFWWEKHIGKIEGLSILEVGCGVNYLVPYWLDSCNEVAAFDVCKESVFLLKDIIRKIGLEQNRLNLFVGDAEQLFFNKKFDVININNVLHHIKDKKKVLIRLKECLKDGGKLLIVEPNYYYPFRWIIETDFFDPCNFIKSYFVRNSLIEKLEKAVIFSKLKNILREVGFKIDVNLKDSNYLGYSITHFIDSNKVLPKIIYKMDKYVISPLLPRILAPFEYLILSKA